MGKNQKWNPPWKVKRIFKEGKNDLKKFLSRKPLPQIHTTTS